MDCKNDYRTPKDRIDGQLYDSQFGNGNVNFDSLNPTQDGYKRGKSLAMAYVPKQKWGDLFSAPEGLIEGTIYKDLRFPFLCGKCNSEVQF